MSVELLDCDSYALCPYQCESMAISNTLTLPLMSPSILLCRKRADSTSGLVGLGLVDDAARGDFASNGYMLIGGQNI